MQKRTTIYLSDEYNDLLNEISEKTKMNKSETIRKALTYLYFSDEYKEVVEKKEILSSLNKK